LRLRNILILLAILLALGGYYYFSTRPEPTPPAESRLYVWLIEMDKIERIELRLPREGVSQAFLKIPSGDQFPWFFADPERSKVDPDRWGGGIPLLLSGPRAERIISESTTAEKLAEFGLIEPQLEIALTLEEGKTLNIKVGNSTPDGHAYYVQSPYSTEVALVDYTWFNVLRRLVKEPPYAPVKSSRNGLRSLGSRYCQEFYENRSGTYRKRRGTLPLEGGGKRVGVAGMLWIL
jgi:hypothetical protein